jgi:hypothetical protein
MKPGSMTATRPLTDKYNIILWKLGLEDKRRFVDITHSPDGKMCTIYYNETTKRYEYEPF